MFLPRKVLEDKLQNMLKEDVGQGDITTALVVPPDSTAEAEVIAEEPGIVAGMEEADILLESIGLNGENLFSDGEEIKTNDTLIRISGESRTILSVERSLLNILSRMSGIATITRKLKDKLNKAEMETKIACTRKVAPFLLYFDKKAVSIGGGDTHRFHLDDLILIKDNHIAVAGNIRKAIKKVKKGKSFSKKIEIEVTRVKDALSVAKEGVEIVMLDNFSLSQIEETVRLLKKDQLYGKVLLEASGGINLDNVLSYAATGVDIVSLGELTDSTKALDIKLEMTLNRD